MNLFFFLTKLDFKTRFYLTKFKKINIIFYSNNNYDEIGELIKFCRIQKFKLYFYDNINFANKYKVDGLCISSSNNKIVINNYLNLDIIGIAHNQKEYSIKCLQNCRVIFISPVFFNSKFSKNKILGLNKFNLIKLRLKKKIYALSGVNKKTVKLLKNSNCEGAGFISAITHPFRI